MDEFKVKVKQMREEADRKRELAQELDRLQDDLKRVSINLRFQISHRDRIDRRLTQQQAALVMEEKKMQGLASSLRDIANQYERTESALAGIDFEEPLILRKWELIDWINLWPLGPIRPYLPFVSIPAILLMLPSFSQKPWYAPKFFHGKLDVTDKKGTVWNLVDKYVDQDNSLYKKARDARDKFEDWKDDHSEKKPFAKGVYDFETGEYTKVDTEDEKAVKKFDDAFKKDKIETDIKLASVGGTIASASVWSGQAMAGSEDGTHASAKASFMEGKVEAEAYAGLYQTDPTTGERTFKPGVGAKVGASFSIFTAEEEAQLGSDMLGVYAKSTQTVGKVGAEAEATIGLYDKEGNLNPSIYAGASVEAIAGEITGSVGAKVLGTDIGVSGSLNYGIGAHANVGFKDGKLSVDVGATLGVGGSIKLEIDVSGTVDAVCEGAKSVWNKITGWF